jgi:small-conductance mechanosensitive channel
VAESVIINYDLPEASTSFSLPIPVGYGADPERVETVLLEEANGAVGPVPGLLDTPAPAVLLIPGFGEHALEFTLVCHVARFADQGRVQHELRKRILKRFLAEGLEFAYPLRAPSA